MSEIHCDILVYGGTSGAVGTAIESARRAYRVLIVSPDEHIGGVQVEGLGATDIDGQAEFQNSPSVGDFGLELHRRISADYGRSKRLETAIKEGIKDPSVWRFESRVAETVIKKWLQEFQNIQIVKASLALDKAVHKNDSEIIQVSLSDGSRATAKIFVDATYEGDLLAAAGVSTTFGREARSVYGEHLAGVRDETIYSQIQVSIDPYKTPGDPSSGLLYGVSSEPFGTPGQGDDHLMAFSFRLPLTDKKDNQLPIYKPHGYDPSHYELYRRHARAGGRLYEPIVRIPGCKTDIVGCEAPLHLDLVGFNDGWVNGSVEKRKKILERATLFSKGLLYFYTTDESLPLAFRQEWQRFGYPLDEFPDNNHFPRMLYIRDARRMVSDYVITQHTAMRDGKEPQVNDPVAIAYWPPDTHDARRVVRDGKVQNEGFVFKDKHNKWKPFGISYRSLIPKRTEVINVLTPTCPSSSHLGYGAIRIEHQFYELGQACAIAANLAIKGVMAVQDVPYNALKEALLARGAKLDASKLDAPSFIDEEISNGKAVHS